MSDMHRALVSAGLLQSLQAKPEPRKPLFFVSLPEQQGAFPFSLSNRFRRNKMNLLSDVRAYLREVSQDPSLGNKFSGATIAGICRLAEDLKEEVPPSKRNAFSVEVIPKLFELERYCSRHLDLSGSKLAKKLISKF